IRSLCSIAARADSGELIEEGQLAAPQWGFRRNAIPAEQLGIGRITVRKAYKELLTQGFVESRRGSGTFVAERPVRISQHLWRLTPPRRI
ncbi:GntR family transcriptional regulator, partial [Brucella abortus]|nr:GntR family transcriptional regulator [Brucella abortus]